MAIHVGIDIAKKTHWVSAIDADGVILLDQPMTARGSPAHPAQVAEAWAGVHSKTSLAV